MKDDRMDGLVPTDPGKTGDPEPKWKSMFIHNYFHKEKKATCCGLQSFLSTLSLVADLPQQTSGWDGNGVEECLCYLLGDQGSELWHSETLLWGVTIPYPFGGSLRKGRMGQ